MTNKETVERNIGLTFDFVHHLIDNPSIVDEIPKKFILEFLEKDFPQIRTTEKLIHENRVNRRWSKSRTHLN